MNKLELVNKFTRTVHKVGFQLKKHSPEILIIAGVAGTVTSAVLACKATRKIDTILEEAKNTIDAIHECVNDPEMEEKYSKKDADRDLAITYLQTGAKLAKLYAPAVILGALSITAIVASNNVLRKRNIALAAAYATVDKGFKEYRGRVVERFGEELDKELRYNIKAKEIEETIVDEETGEEKVVKKTVNVADPNQNSIYGRFFDEYCTGWDKDAEHNLIFVKQQQNYANEILKSRGHLFLNEVYDMLGLPKTKAGQIVGWIYDEMDPIGDNYVDFGIYDLYNEKARDFVNGRERSIFLDFNVDGNILEYI